MIECFINQGQLFKSCIRFFDMDSIAVTDEESLLTNQEIETLKQKK